MAITKEVKKARSEIRKAKHDYKRRSSGDSLSSRGDADGCATYVFRRVVNAATYSGGRDNGSRLPTTTGGIGYHHNRRASHLGFLILLACLSFAKPPLGEFTKWLFANDRSLQHDGIPPCLVAGDEEGQPPRTIMPKAVPPTFTASYPGSGAKLTWNMIRMITGIYTGDDFDHDGLVQAGQVVSIKTHYPAHGSPEENEAFHRLPHDSIDNAVLLLRNPLTALPSHHNYIHEMKYHLKSHSTKAPVREWIKWRDIAFDIEMKKWVNHTKYWLDNYNIPEKRLLLLPFEALTDETDGPYQLRRLGDFLATVHPDIRQGMVPPTKIPCVWNHFVKEQVPGESPILRGRAIALFYAGTTESLAEQEGDYDNEEDPVYTYTPQQLETMLQALSKLKESQDSKFPEISALLQQYMEEVFQAKVDAESKIAEMGEFEAPRSEPWALPWAQEMIQSHELYSKLLNVDQELPFDQTTQVPFYWYLTRSGGKALEHWFRCLGRVTPVFKRTPGCNTDEEEEDGGQKGLHLCQVKKRDWINADTSTSAGIHRAKRYDLVGRRFDNFVLQSPLFHDAMTLLDEPFHGRLFVMIRDPVARAISKFYPEFYKRGQNMTMMEYAESDLVDSNYYTRKLVNKREGEELSPNHLVLAKEILRQKTLVLLTSEMEESADRMAKYFGWYAKEEDLIPKQKECLQRFAVEEPLNPLNPYTQKNFQTPQDGDPIWKAIATRNLYDLELYDYAKQVFQQQGVLSW